MIYIRGDTHGELSCFRDPKLSALGSGDKLIITGDFGFVFRGGDDCPEERERLDALARLPYEILFVDGNHEGFDYLERCPERMRYGAPVRQLRPNIFWPGADMSTPLRTRHSSPWAVATVWTRAGG
ncbi:MAG: metallophosphoesterase [Oscillospiraceae bacterium]|nr:metallophosphoesterase [Oscillospiraceae bacterium]